MSPPRLAFVGTGPVARALAESWAHAGGAVSVVLSRDAGRAARLATRCGARAATDPGALRDADVVMVCVPDRVVAEVGRALAGSLRPSGALVLHTSGSLPGRELNRGAGGEPLRAGSLHPLQSFPSAGPPEAADREPLVDRVPGIHWFHEGEGRDEARSMVALWRGTCHALAPGGKALYHAGAAIVSNHAVALFADATRLLAAAGVPPDEARPALAALLAGTAANLAAVGVPAALTGPVARGDVVTVRSHVAALRAAAPDLLDAYRALARRAVVVAREKGTIDGAVAASLEDELR